MSEDVKSVGQLPVQHPVVGLVMGSKNDWSSLKPAADMLTEFAIAFEVRVVSAHRTPDLLHEYGKTARARGLKIIIAGAGGAAHLPGMLAALTPLPVLAVPVSSKTLNGIDSLLSIVCMPKGVPVATFAIGEAGAANAALTAVAIFALTDTVIAGKLDAFRAAQTAQVLAHGDPRL
jgi:5-(carboxyamino)imidazole ribonucleotide mutase